MEKRTTRFLQRHSRCCPLPTPPIGKKLLKHRGRSTRFQLMRRKNLFRKKSQRLSEAPRKKRSLKEGGNPVRLWQMKQLLTLYQAAEQLLQCKRKQEENIPS